MRSIASLSSPPTKYGMRTSVSILSCIFTGFSSADFFPALRRPPSEVLLLLVVRVKGVAALLRRLALPPVVGDDERRRAPRWFAGEEEVLVWEEEGKMCVWPHFIRATGSLRIFSSSPSLLERRSSSSQEGPLLSFWPAEEEEDGDGLGGAEEPS